MSVGTVYTYTQNIHGTVQLLYIVIKDVTLTGVHWRSYKMASSQQHQMHGVTELPFGRYTLLAPPHGRN